MEFPKLVNTAVALAKGNKAKVIVISIPDYAFTPIGQGSDFGKGPDLITNEINMYNNYIGAYCNNQSITFINITDITRMGLINIDLVAFDGLHPSELAYSKFVERILPKALQKLQ